MKDLEVDLQGNEHTRFTLIFSVLILQYIFLVLSQKLNTPPPEIYIFSPKKQRDFRATLPTTK
jgi:hypothetical protein